MSGTYYHVDRRGELSAGQTIDLEAVDDRRTDGRYPVSDLYPGGLSRHGRHYCTQDLYTDDGDELWDVACELLFELVRRDRYPERPSRFQSVFAFQSLDAAERFADGFVDEPTTVWRVSADRSFVADMRLVDAESLADGFDRARYYWTGRSFRDDPLWEVLLVPPVAVGTSVREVGGG